MKRKEKKKKKKFDAQLHEQVGSGSLVWAESN